VSGERIPRVAVARAFVTVAVRPPRIVAGVTAALVRVGFARVARPSSEVPPLVSVAWEGRWPAPFVVPFVITTRAAAPATVAHGRRALVVARVVIARVEIHLVPPEGAGADQAPALTAALW
jgi:hypothetical protein